MTRGFLVRLLHTLWLCTLLLACDARGVRSDTPALEPLSTFPLAPLTIRTASGERAFDVWVADTPARRSRGLMFVERLEAGSGMLFLYREPQTISMWMKNTLIPLDMLFVAADGRITRIARETKPQSLTGIGSLGYVTAVIEIGGGEAQRLGIETGDRVVHPAFEGRESQ